MPIPVKITHFWFVLLFGYVLHTILMMIPVFYGQSLAAEGADPEGINTAKWFNLIVYLVPMVLILMIQASSLRILRYINLLFVALFFLLNTLHPMELLGASETDWTQLILMIFIIIFNAFLIYYSWRWAWPSKKEIIE